MKENIEIFPLEKSKKLYENFSQKIKNHSISKDIQYRLYIVPNTIIIGKVSPEIEGVNIENEVVKLSNYKGKYVLLDFWASWCAPCRKEIPLLKELYKKYNKYGFEILSFSLDTDFKNLLNAVNKENFDWESISDLKGFSSDIAKKYNVTAIPKNFLISPEGKIIEINKHDEELVNLLKKVFNN